MIGSMERVMRFVSAGPLMPSMMLVMAVNVSTPTDPKSKTIGYGGVLPVPAAPSAPITTTSAKTDGAVEHRDIRSARGRVLYATGKAPQTTAAPRTEATKPQCERRVVQGKAPSPAPNS